MSPFKPFGPVLALCFVLVVGALKAIAEDRRRHVEDNHLNNSTAHVLNPDGEPENFTSNTMGHGRRCWPGCVQRGSWPPLHDDSSELSAAMWSNHQAQCAAGSTADIKWSGVKVGQVLKVLNDEDFPADLLCLHCALDDNVCFIKTTNLDGAPRCPSPISPMCTVIVSQMLLSLRSSTSSLVWC